MGFNKALQEIRSRQSCYAGQGQSWSIWFNVEDSIHSSGRRDWLNIVIFVKAASHVTRCRYTCAF